MFILLILPLRQNSLRPSVLADLISDFIIKIASAAAV